MKNCTWVRTVWSLIFCEVSIVILICCVSSIGVLRWNVVWNIAICLVKDRITFSFFHHKLPNYVISKDFFRKKIFFYMSDIWVPSFFEFRILFDSFVKTQLPFCWCTWRGAFINLSEKKNNETTEVNKVTVDTGVYELNFDYIKHYIKKQVKHKNLKKLCLFEISQSERSGVLKSLQLYEDLIGLKLTFYPFCGASNNDHVNNDNVALQVVEKLNKSESLMIGFANLDESLIVNIVRLSGASMKELHLHMCNMQPLNKLLLDNIDNTRKTNQQLWTISPLKLFVDDEIVENIQNEKSRTHLSVHRGCDHSAIWWRSMSTTTILTWKNISLYYVNIWWISKMISIMISKYHQTNFTLRNNFKTK